MLDSSLVDPSIFVFTLPFFVFSSTVKAPFPYVTVCYPECPVFGWGNAQDTI